MGSLKKKNQGGQAVIEAILILVILIGLSRSVSVYFKNNEIIKKLVNGPWQSLSSMIQNGDWDARGAQNSKTRHPNYQERHISVLGD